jgi:hypothetical protein
MPASSPITSAVEMAGASALPGCGNAGGRHSVVHDPDHGRRRRDAPSSRPHAGNLGLVRFRRLASGRRRRLGGEPGQTGASVAGVAPGETALNTTRKTVSRRSLRPNRLRRDGHRRRGLAVCMPRDQGLHSMKMSHCARGLILFMPHKPNSPPNISRVRK